MKPFNADTLLPSRHSSDGIGKKSAIVSGKILSRYVKKNALLAMLFSVIGLWALQLLFSYLGELDNFTDTYTYADAIKYVFYRSPYFLEQFTPTGALLGAVVGLGLLANNSELIIMRAAGLSIYRIVWWVLQPAFIFVLIALAVNQYVLPQTNLKASQVRKPDTALLASVDGYWAFQKDNSDDSKAANSATGEMSGHNIVFIDYADASGNIGEVKRWHLDANNNLTSVSKAKGGTYLSKPITEKPLEETGTAANSPVAIVDTVDVTNTATNSNNSSKQPLTQYHWQLNDVSTLTLAERAAFNNLTLNSANIANGSMANQKVSNEASDGIETGVKSHTANNNRTQYVNSLILNDEPLVTQQTSASEVFSLPIAPSSVYLLTRRAEDLSLTQLYEHKRFNDSQGTRSLEHELAFWQKLLSPFAILSLVIVACSFVFGSLRTHSLGLRVVVALLFGLLFSYMQDLTGFVSLATGVSPLLMVLLPIIGSAILGFYLIKRQS